MALSVSFAWLRARPREMPDAAKAGLLLVCLKTIASSVGRENSVKNDAAVTKTLRDLMDAQRLAVLATHDTGQPHGSLVAFVVSDDLRDLVFATSRATRKFANLSKDARVALVVDNRTNQEADFQQAIAVTISGRASEVSANERAQWVKRYLQRHPCLQEFVQSPSCALVQVHVEKYNLVERFQNVVEIRFEP